MTNPGVVNPTADVARPWRHDWRYWLGLVVVLGVLAAATAWFCQPRPALPEIDLADAPPAVAEAVATARAAVIQSPRSGWAWGELGMVLYANDYAPQAYRCFVQAEALDPQTPMWPYLQALRLLIHDREGAMPPLQRAVALLEQIPAADPTPRLLLAEMLFEKDQCPQAAALCREVLAQDADNARAHFNLGLIALATDHPAESIEHLTRAATSPCSAQRSCRHMAFAMQRLGDTASARALLQRAKDLPEDRRWPDPYVQKAKEYEAGPQRHQQQAEQLAAQNHRGEYLLALRDLAAESGDGLSHYRLGVALAKEGDLAAAEPVLRTALSKAPDMFGAHFALGIVLLREAQRLEPGAAASPAGQAKFQAAADRMHSAIALRPAYGLAHLSLGQALQGLARPRDARAEFERAVQCQPELMDAHLALGEALAAAGETAAGLRHLEQAQRLAPADPRPPAALARWRPAGRKTAAPQTP